VRVACVGGGPGGLFLAILLGRAGRHSIDVFERHTADVTYGFGVVFSRMSAVRLRAVAPDVIEEIFSLGVRWQKIEVCTSTGSFASFGHSFGAVGRRPLLDVLRKHAHAAGVRIHNGCTAEHSELVRRYDAVIAADGAGSSTRREVAAVCEPTIVSGKSRYIWLGMNRAVDSMKFFLSEADSGLVGAHVYPYSSDASTFLVEMPEDVWRRAWPGGEDPCTSESNDASAVRYCETTFASALDGARLIGNGAGWRKFFEVRNKRWSAPPVVLIGDAAHTAHFSVGSGTSMAMEDSAELARCMERFSALEDAFDAYEAARRPAVEGIQDLAWTSSQFWEHLQNEEGRSASELMLRLLTRTGQTDLGTLLRLDGNLSSSIGRIAPTSCVKVARPLLAWRRVHYTPGTERVGLVEFSETTGLGDRPVDVQCCDSMAVVARWEHDGGSHLDEVARGIGEVGELAPAIPNGLLLTISGDGSIGAVVERSRAYLDALKRGVHLDFVAIGRTDSSSRARAIQMILCDFVKSELGLAAAYACKPEEMSHAQTHVQAGRADQIWMVQA
jgi:2-polyprenyl-6-methoxyphenol hydroxylase-like FAD-dependent oxidoreductase